MPLRALTLGYLYLPFLLFLGGWVRPWLAATIALLLASAAYRARGLLAERVVLPRRAVAAALLAALAWTALSGVAGLGRRNTDWGKHDAILAGVVEKTWPVVYERELPGLEGKRHALVFYLAYYLPAGAVGKLLGFAAAHVALAFWSACGLALVLLWTLELLAASGRAALGLLLFLFASGMDALGHLARTGRLFRATEHLEWWAVAWQYSSDTSLLFWVPHQALGGWLATALLLDGLVREREGSGAGIAPLELAGALFWSPFATLGALPFALLRVARAPRELARSWSAGVAAAAVGGLLVVYYAAIRQHKIPRGFDGERLLGELAAPYLLFVLLEFGLVLVLVRPRASGGSPWRAIWWTAGVSLVAIPFYRLGLYNDFAMRSSIPALFALWLLAGRALLDGGVPRWRRAALGVLLAVGAATPATEIARAVSPYRVALPDAASTPPLLVLHASPELAAQYTGPLDALFFRFMSRTPPPPAR